MKRHDMPDARRLMGCYPCPPNDYRARVRYTLNALPREEEKTVKKKLSAGLVIAIAVMLAALGALAAALNGGVLDYLFFSAPQQADQALTDMVTPVAAQAELAGIRVTVTDAVCDGARLALSFTAENTDPACRTLVEVAGATFDGAALYPEYETLDNCWLPGFPEDTSARVSTGLMGEVTLPEGKDTAEVTLTLALSVPSQPLVIVDGEALMTAEELGEAMEDAEYAALIRGRLDQVLTAGDVTVADSEHQDPAWWLAQGYTPVNLYGMFLCEEDFTFESVNRGHRPGQMREVGEVTVRFTMDISAARTAIRDLTPAAPFRLSAGTLTVTRALVSPLSLLIDFDYVPDDQSLTGTLLGLEVPQIVDDSGIAVDFPDSYGESSMGGLELPDGRWGVSASIASPAPKAFPSALRLDCGTSPLAKEILSAIRIATE